MDQSSKDQPTPLSKIGEFALIKHLTDKVGIKHKTTLKGIGDDAAIIEGGEEEIVVTTDMLCEGIHFDLLYTPIKHLGYKAVVVNLSDIYAMNARPEQITVSIAVSNKISIEFLEDFYEGIQLACDNYQVEVLPYSRILQSHIDKLGRGAHRNLLYVYIRAFICESQF